MAKYDKTMLRRAALAPFEEPNGMTWHQMAALLDFFEELRLTADNAPHFLQAGHIRLLGVLDFMKASGAITDEQHDRLASLADEIN